MALPLKFKPVLSWKLILSTSALIALTSIALGWYAYAKSWDLIESVLMDRGRKLAQDLAFNNQYLVGVLPEEGKDEIKKLVEGVIREEDVLYAVIQTDRDTILASALSHQYQFLEIPPRTITRKPKEHMIWIDPLTQASQVKWAGQTIYEITYPINLDPKREREELVLGPDGDRKGVAGKAKTIGFATVGMSLSTKRIDDERSNMVRRISLLTGLVILAGVLFTIVFAKAIAGPVKELAEAARHIAEGDPRSHVRVKSRDEIGDLADSFNRMADAVQQREGELREINTRLETASRHKSQFLANMSHELRTPLNAILGFTGILLNKSIETTGDERQEFLSNIKTSGKSLLGLINEVLDLSKIEAGKMDLNLKPFSLSGVLEDVQLTIRPLADAKHIAIGMTVDDRLSSITADEVKFKQILYNLLGNAIKFRPEQGKVHFGARLTADGTEFSVRDTGIGIRPEDQARIFQEFEQVEMSSERHYEGTGLGLTLVKKLVELLGGRIWVESEFGKGSTFVFVLPSNSRSSQAFAGTGERPNTNSSNAQSEI